MDQRLNVYRCNVCGHIVEVLTPGAGELVCCDQPMELLGEQKKEDEGNEKHVPVIEKDGDEVIVKVGSAPHPMEEKHLIEWIELIVDGVAYRKFLKPGDAPEAKFKIEGENLTAREYCTVHNLWSS